MHKDLGRLALKDIKDNETKINKIFKSITDGKIDSAKKEIVKLLSTPNYYVRELIGKKLVDFPNGDLMDQIILDMLGHKIYGVRAAIIFYYYLKYNHDPEKIITLLNMSWEDTPWEVEHILFELWAKHPEIMKKEMTKWTKSQFEKQRALAYHGMEQVTEKDPYYIFEIIKNNIDDVYNEVQKKISILLFNVALNRPIESYPFIRQLLLNLNERRLKIITFTMKKLLKHSLNSKTNKTTKKEFQLLTHQTIKDWKSDPHKEIANLGKKLIEWSKTPDNINQDVIDENMA
ncbi:MAG: hypothetical protein PHY08_03145 [Candidatus Cloacimonetes bacterium]|nr:hypothetical protein [Candidatus Cloacimonadota bacterium]MDD4155549.1 hypothetical protein [Candidatus Cloacimonadota bacterium]